MGKHGQRRGQVVIPSALTERIASVIKSLDKGDFTIADIQRYGNGLSRRGVRNVLAAKARQGWLERTGKGSYRVGGVRIKTKLPHGMLAEAVWAVLSTDPERRFKRREQLVGEVEEYIGRPGYSAVSSVSAALSYWYRDGHLERTGDRGEFAWRLREGVEERPACTRLH